MGQKECVFAAIVHSSDDLDLKINSPAWTDGELTKNILDIISAAILACGGSLLAAVGCKLYCKHFSSSDTSDAQYCSDVFVSRMHDSTRVTQISTTD